jgi:hypothetical protein
MVTWHMNCYVFYGKVSTADCVNTCAPQVGTVIHSNKIIVLQITMCILLARVSHDSDQEMRFVLLPVAAFIGAGD